MSRKRRFRPPRLLVKSAVIVVGLLVGLALGWILVTGLLARREAIAAQTAVDRLRADVRAAELSNVAASIDQIRLHSRRAHILTSGPAWFVGAHLPWLGRPIASARGLAERSDELANDVLLPLAQVSDRLDVTHLVDRGKISLQPLIDAAPLIRAATTRLSTAQVQVAALPAATWLPTVDRARDHLLTSMNQLRDQLDSANRATSVLPDMLGARRVQRYFVGLENEAESRGLGGIPGAFAIATADHGQIKFTTFQSDTELYNVKADVDLGAEYEQRYGRSDPTATYPNSTIGPDFRDAARIWMAMWYKHTGQRIDGAIAVDPTAIGYLLKVTGPARLADGQSVRSDNVSSLTQQSVYQRFPATAQRKAYLLQIASAISNRLISAHGSTDLFRAVATAASQRRIMIWSADQTAEDALRQTGIAGTLDSQGHPFAGFTTVNATGGKLDYYLRRSMTYQRSGCGATESTASLVLTNAVPAGPLPAYVTLRVDRPPYPTKPGDNKVLVSYYATPRSRIAGVTVDGVRTIVAPGTEKGLTVFTLPLELPRGSTRKVTVRVTESAASAPVRILTQPAVHPVVTSVSSPTCG